MDSAKTLEQAKTAVFGKDPALGTDGQPLERGVGSPWHKAEHIAKAHFHAATAWAACDELVAGAKALLASAEKISAAVKASIEAAAAAKAEQPVPTMTFNVAADVPVRSVVPGADEQKPYTLIKPAENHTLDFASVPSPEK